MSREEEFRLQLNQNPAFLAKRVFDLHLLIMKQAQDVYTAKGIVFPVAVSSTMLYLASVEGSSLTQASKALGQPHQLIAQRIKVLKKLELLETYPCQQDKRRTEYRLSEQGQQQAALLDEYCVEAAVAFADISNELELDLQGLLNDACAALEKRSFGQRFPSLQEK